MPLSPIWAFGAILLWQLLARIPLSIAPETLWPEALSLGFIGAAVAINWIDARYFPSELARSILPRQRIWLLYGLVAGMGFAILGSEFGNIGEAIANNPIPLEGAPPTSTNPLTNALLGSIVYPVCFIFVLVGISQRALLNWTTPWITICIIALIGTFGGPFSRMAQLALVCGLPAWLYARSGSVALAIVAYLPTTALPLLTYAGVEPGIVGFDVVETTGRIIQPIWFNLLGAAFIAGGIGPLLKAMTQTESEPT